MVNFSKYDKAEHNPVSLSNRAAILKSFFSVTLILSPYAVDYPRDKKKIYIYLSYPSLNEIKSLY